MEKLVELKEKLNYTNVQCARHFNVSERTISRWLQDTEFGKARERFRTEQLTSARVQISSLSTDIIANLVDLMTNAKSELVRWNAAKTLGEWMGLHEIPKETGTSDERDELLTILRQRNAAYVPPLLAPPLPGGALPFVEGEVLQIEEGEKVPR